MLGFIKYFLFLVAGLLTVVVIFLSYIACQLFFEQNHLPWEWDINYSKYLTTRSDHYEYVTGHKSADTVDSLRIFKNLTRAPEWYNLREILKEEPALETQDRHSIRKFVLAAQERWTFEDNFDPAKGCRRDKSKRPRSYKFYDNRKRPESFKFYAVMFDNTFNRAGYFLAVLCKSQEKQYPDKEYIQISVTDHNGLAPIVYYNESLVSTFKSFRH